MSSVDAPPPFEAYKGRDPFAFVSYSHKDGVAVFNEISRLHDEGYRIWYDEGIDPGNEWPEEVATALSNSSFFIVFISNQAVISANVRNEINYALTKGKPFLAIHLQEAELPPGLDLRMGSLQAILKHRMSEDSYNRKLAMSLPMSLKSPEGNLPIERPGALRAASRVWKSIQESIERVSIEVSQYRFTGYEDRDSNGLLYHALIGAPTRDVLKDNNSEVVWNETLKDFAGEEVDALVRYVDQGGLDELSRSKALLLLRCSLQTNPDKLAPDSVLAILAKRVEGTPIVQEAALSVLDESPFDSDLKWKHMSRYLRIAGQERMSFVLRSLWQWVPLSEQSSFCDKVFQLFRHATTKWAACNCLYAVRKTASRDILPAARELLSTTPSIWRAWYLARLVEDFQDTDATSALRNAFVRHLGASNYSWDMAGIIYSLEGDEALPFLCRVALKGSPELQKSVF